VLSGSHPEQAGPESHGRRNEMGKMLWILLVASLGACIEEAQVLDEEPVCDGDWVSACVVIELDNGCYCISGPDGGLWCDSMAAGDISSAEEGHLWCLLQTEERTMEISLEIVARDTPQAGTQCRPPGTSVLSELNRCP
jgi:hypothetical protein